MLNSPASPYNTSPDILDYDLYVFPFAQPNGVRLNIQNKSPSDVYFLSSFRCKYNVFNPMEGDATFQIVVKDLNDPAVIPVLHFAGGNIVKLTENGKTRYIGYIATFDVYKNRPEGSVIVLHVKSQLMQLQMQSVVNSIQDIAKLGTNTTIADFLSNKVPMTNIIQWFSNESLISYISNPKNNINPNPTPFVFRNGPENTLNANTSVWFYAALNTNRLDGLLKVIYPYQRIMYQDQDGTIRIEPLSIQQYQSVNNNSNIYIFDLFNNSTGGFTAINSTQACNWESWYITNNEADIINRYYAALVYAGLALADDTNNNGPIVYVSTPTNTQTFNRNYQLLNSGHFENSACQTIDLSNNMLTDLTLLTYVDKNYSKFVVTNQSQNNPVQKALITQLYASRGLAESLYLDTIVEIDTIRVTNYLENIPLAKCISINNPTLLDTNNFFCFGAELSYNEAEGGLLKLLCCKPYTYTAYWTNALT